MTFPNFKEERKLQKKGYKRIAGLDEAGRGPLAGPVVAGAVRIRTKNKKQITEDKKILREVRDSKKLTPKKREEIYKLLIKNSNIEWGVGRVSERVIDKINILEATKLAMKRALRNLEKKLRRTVLRNWGIEFLILDGNFKIDYSCGSIRISRGRAKRGRGLDHSYVIPQKSIKRADEKVLSCACASIIAKVTRDRIMVRKDNKYPKYGFSKHKGYGTKLHLKMLRKYGPCKIHRKSFKPVEKSAKRKAGSVKQ